MTPRTAMSESSIPAHGKVDSVPFAAVDAANGMRFRALKHQILLVKNGSASPVTVTITKATDDAGRSGSDQLTVAAGDIGAAGPFAPEVYRQPSGGDAGYVQVDFSDGTSVEYALLEVDI